MYMHHEMVNNSPIKNFKSQLQCFYQSQNEIPKLLEIYDNRLYRTWDEHYLPLTLINREITPAIGNNFIDERKTIPLDSIFDNNRKVLVLGEGGTGKSTLLHYIAYSWGNNKLLSTKFDVVFKIQLKYLLIDNWKYNYTQRDLRRDKLVCFIHYNLLQCSKLHRFSGREPKEVTLEDIINFNNKCATLLLIDGYDQVSHLVSSNDVDFQEVMKAVYQYQFLIMSSRPNAIKINEIVEKFDLSLKIKCLDLDENIRYVKSFYDDEKELGNNLISFLEHSNQLRRLCETPIYMGFLCLIWEDENIKRSFIENADVSSQLLCHKVILWLVKKFFNFLHGNLKEENASPEIFQQKIISILQNIAFDSFVEQGNLVNGKVIKKHLGKLDIGVIYILGMLSRVDGYFDEKFQFNHQIFQEFFTALCLKNKLKSKIGDDVKNACTFISQHRNMPKYLKVLKYLASMVSNQQVEDEELVKRTWESFTCNVDGVLEFDVQGKVTLLMHLLEQSKVEGKFDKRIPNLIDIITFVDTVILSDIAQWQESIIESGYISNKIKEHLDSIFDNVATVQDEIQLRVAVEICANLANKTELGGKSRVVQNILKLLSSSKQIQLQRLALEKVEQLLDLTVSVDLLKNNLRPVLLLVNNYDLVLPAIDLISKIVRVFPDLFRDVVSYIKLAMEDFNCNSFYFAALVDDVAIETVWFKSDRDNYSEVSVLIFEIRLHFILNFKYEYLLHHNLVASLMDGFNYFPKNLLPEKINRIFLLFQNIIINPTGDGILKNEAIINLPKLTKLFPETERSERFDTILTWFEPIFKHPESTFTVQRSLILSLPKLLNVLPAERTLEKMFKIFDLLYVTFEIPQLNKFLICIVMDYLPMVVKLFPDFYQSNVVIRSLNLIEKLLKKRATKLITAASINCVSKLVKCVKKTEILPDVDGPVKLFYLLFEMLNYSSSSEDFKKVVVRGIIQLIKNLPPHQKFELIDQVFNLLADVIYKQSNFSNLKVDILNEIPSLIDTNSVDTRLLDKTKVAVSFVEVIQASGGDLLTKISATRATLTFNSLSTFHKSEPSSFLSQINRTIGLINEVRRNFAGISPAIFDAICSLLEFNLIPDLANLPKEQKFEKAVQIFGILEIIMRNTNVSTFRKCTISCIVGKLLQHMPTNEYFVTMDNMFDLLCTAILESSDLALKFIILNSLPRWVSMHKRLSMNDILQLSEAVLNDPNVNIYLKTEAVSVVGKLCKSVSNLSHETIFNALRNKTNTNWQTLIYIEMLNVLVRSIIKEEFCQTADDAVDILINILSESLCDKHLQSVALSSLVAIVKIASENQDTFLNVVLEKLESVLLGNVDYDSKFVIIRGLPEFITAVEGSENTVLVLLQKALYKDIGLQCEIITSIAVVVENCTDFSQEIAAKQAFEILSGQIDDIGKYFDICSVDCLAKIVGRMSINESVKLLQHENLNVCEGAKIGILNKLTTCDVGLLVQLDYTRFLDLLNILDCCKQKKETSGIDNILYAATSVKVKNIIEKIKDDGIIWIIDNLHILAQFSELKIVLTGVLRKILSRTNEGNRNIYAIMIQYIKLGFPTTIQRIISGYRITIADILYSIYDDLATDFDDVISAALRQDNILAKQYRENKAVFINSGSQNGLPISASDFLICSLVNKNSFVFGDNWHLSLLHLSDQNKSEPSSVFVLFERRDHFGLYLIRKVHAVHKQVRVTSFEYQPNEINIDVYEEIFGEMWYDIKNLIKPRYYASVYESLPLKEGNELINDLKNCKSYPDNTEYEIIHNIFKKYFADISWEQYIDEENVVEIKKDFLFPFDISDRSVRRDSETIDKFIGSNKLKEQQTELQNEIELMKVEVDKSSKAAEVDKLKIHKMLDKLQLLDKNNSDLQRRVVEITRTIHFMLNEGEISAERISLLEIQCDRLQATSAHISQLNNPHVNYFGSEEPNDNDTEDYLGLR